MNVLAHRMLRKALGTDEEYDFARTAAIPKPLRGWFRGEWFADRVTGNRHDRRRRWRVAAEKLADVAAVACDLVQLGRRGEAALMLYRAGVSFARAQLAAGIKTPSYSDWLEARRVAQAKSDALLVQMRVLSPEEVRERRFGYKGPLRGTMKFRGATFHGYMEDAFIEAEESDTPPMSHAMRVGIALHKKIEASLKEISPGEPGEWWLDPDTGSPL